MGNLFNSTEIGGISSSRFFHQRFHDIHNIIIMAATAIIEGAASSSSTTAISNRLHLSHVNPDLSKNILHEQLKILFSRFGTVQEVFLSTRCGDPFGFIVMGTRDEAQSALVALYRVCEDRGGVSSTSLSPTSTLFRGVKGAMDFQPRNKRAIQNLERTIQNFHGRLHLAKTSTIICQVHKSHQQRFKDYLVALEDQKEGSIELVGSVIPEFSRSTTLVFLKPRKTGSGSHSKQVQEEDETATGDDDDESTRLTRELWSKWYLASAIHRITVLDNSLSSGSGVLQGSLKDVVVPAIYRSIKESLLRDAQQIVKEIGIDEDHSLGTTADDIPEIDNGLCLIRLAVFPPKLLQPLLEEVENQWESTFLPMLLVSESEHTTPAATGSSNNRIHGLPKVKFSPTNATHTLAITMLHEGIGNIYQGDEEEQEVSGWSSGPPPPTARSATGALYALGRLERIVTVNGTKRTKPDDVEGARSGHNNNNYNRSDNTRNANDDSISRAYWKLQEAWERYKYGPPTNGLRCSNNINNGTDGVGVIRALDCGSAPGGWTKFLYDRYYCKCVYSVDPGHLAPQVLDLDPSVIRHMQCTIQQAFVQLVQERDHHQMQQDASDGRESAPAHKKDDDGRPFLDIWVSDMCVKHMPAQVDLFLEAVRLGLVGPGTFFVLTLKCVLGHSHNTFDLLVQDQVNRLVGHPTVVPSTKVSNNDTTWHKTTNGSAISPGGPSRVCRDIQVLHLFANRSSERTIVGYLS